MPARKKPDVKLLDMSAAEQDFLTTTPDRKPKKARESVPGWKCCSIWLPTAVVETLTEEASRLQYKPQPNLSLYLREMLVKKAESIQRKGA